MSKLAGSHLKTATIQRFAWLEVETITNRDFLIIICQLRYTFHVLTYTQASATQVFIALTNVSLLLFNLRTLSSRQRKYI